MGGTCLLSYIEFYKDLYVPKEYVTAGRGVEGVLIAVLREPYLCCARIGRLGQHLDSDRIFLPGRNFTIYSPPQESTPL